MSKSNFANLIPVMIALPCFLIGLQGQDAVTVASTLSMGMATTIATTKLGQAWGSLKENWFPGNYVGEEIQEALSASFAEAMQVLEKNFYKKPEAQALSSDSKANIKAACKYVRVQGKQALSNKQLHLEDENSFADFLLKESRYTEKEIRSFLETSGLLDALMSNERLLVDFFLLHFIHQWRLAFERQIKENDVVFRAFMIWQTFIQHSKQDDQSQAIQIIKDDVGWLRRSQTEQEVFDNLPDFEEYFFSHQSDVLDELHRELLPGRKIVLTGVQGVGKTLTALEYARQLNINSGVSVFWVGAESDSQLLNEFASLAEELGIDMSFAYGVRLQDRAAQLRVAAQQVRDIIAKRKDWLLIIDNLDGWFFTSDQNEKAMALLDDVLPSPLKGRVLITSCDRPQAIESVKGYRALELKMMSFEDGARFLLNRTGREAYIPQNVANGDEFITSEKQQVWHDALAISQSVGGLPLALDQASAYINQMNLGFSLGDYLRIYRQEGQPLIGQATYSGSHKPVAATLSLAMKRLLDSPQASVRLAGEMLKLFAFLAPIDIPLRLADMALTNMIFTNTKQDMTPVDIIDVLQHAHDLRLLNYDAQQQVISLHQIVHDVIWEIIDSQEEKLNWLSHAVRVVASAIEATDISPVNIYLHVHALSLRIQLLQNKGLDLEAFWQQKRGESNIVRLREIVEDLKVLAAIENGARWEILVFGTEDPTYGDFVHSYVGWHNVEDPHWQKRSEHIIASISRVCSPNLARNVFVCLAMLMHYWWGSYMLEDPSTEPLLDIWQRSHTNLRDQKLVKVLRTLFRRYPPERNYQAQKSSYSRSNWKAVRNACAEIKDIMLADIPEEDRNSPSYRYAFAMLNIYEAQARTAALQAGQEPDLGALTLIEEAEEFLWDNEDFYHAVWAIRELSEAYFRLAGQHLQLSSFRQSEKVQLEEKAAELFAHANQTAVRGIETSIDMAKQQNDELDLEVLTNLFRLQADITWLVRKDVRQSGVYRCICIYSAYIWIQSEMDEFSTEFFAEQIERTIAWWQELKDISTELLTKAIELMSLFWHKPSLPTTNNLIENGQWENLCQMLLPVGLTRTELTEEAAVDSYLQQVAKVEASMVERLPILSGKLQHELPDSFAKILKVRATSTDK